MKKSVVVLLHIAYWFMYLFLISFIIKAMDTAYSIKTISHLLYTLFFSQVSIFCIVPALIGFYSHYLILFNKFLSKKKIVQLVLASLGIALFGWVFTDLVLFSKFYYGTRSTMYMSAETFIFVGLFLSFLTIVHGIIGLVMKGFLTWYTEIKLKSELDKKNYEMEIALMKAQINPHFLFNTINNIDVLIEKDAGKASEYLNKLSDIMRFMLYETKTEKIQLSMELKYIEQYVELQRIRTSNPDYIKFTVDCENNYSFNEQLNPEFGGLGNELIARRLMLLYPKKHKLETSSSSSSGVYKVYLLISLLE